MKDGVLQTLEWTKQIQFDNKDYFDQQPRRLYTWIDPKDGIKKVGGYYRHADNFTLIITPKAGHMVPVA